MARQVQIIKGTTAQNEAFTGAEGALSYDSDKKNLHVHDGETEGGFEIPSSAMADYVIYWDSADSTDHSHAKPGVSTPTDHGWYRLYKSGWVEQGGFCSGTAEDNPVTLAIEMKDTEYTIVATNMQTTAVNAWGWVIVSRDSQTTTGFSLGGRQGSGSVTPVRTHWQVTGMSAQ